MDLDMYVLSTVRKKFELPMQFILFTKVGSLRVGSK